MLIFDLHIIDFHNPKDQVDINVIYKPADCNLTSAANDLIVYRYNCSLLDGTRLYSSYVLSMGLFINIDGWAWCNLGSQISMTYFGKVGLSLERCAEHTLIKYKSLLVF